ncbi:MAG: tRNA lysidine(34) synthetase TilS [Albidovulum sp.]|uniref:tRNA lysidine(34) synthetase TilS n=1 Tax=Albidovulum sp. TaxID=1872424 RepID=UPI003CAC03D7
MRGGDLLSILKKAFAPSLPDRLGVAVSGGGDSMALLCLAADWAAEGGPPVMAITVDHRLRPGSVDEARMVARFCATLGVPQEVRVWNHAGISGNLQDTARRARYRLIADWAREKGITHVATGHTADDQAECVLMGLARAAGIDGLSGMRRNWSEHGILWQRPFLDVTRQTLRDELTARGVGWVEDPTNEDDRYTRVKARKVLQALTPLGIKVPDLANVADNLAQVRQVVVEATAEIAGRIVREAGGELVVDRDAFLRLAPETARRLLVGALIWTSGAEYAPRADAVQRLKAAIRERRDATLWGCKIALRGHDLRINREPKAVAGLEGPTDAIWDNRWRLSGPHDAGLVVRALGSEGLTQCPDWRESAFPRAALIVSPAIWRDETLISAPLAGFSNGWAAEIVAGYHSFLISH